ncbi:MAG: Zn-ribbon domain-containing OB-fold protein [Chloroflexota bacterium]
MADYNKPLPTPDPVTQPFWDSLKAHAIQLQKCGGCSTYVYYPRSVCPGCGSDDLSWTAVSGRGTVHAFAIPHRHPNRVFTADGPYVVALVELAEGAKIMSNLVDVDPTPDAIKVGMAVEIVYDDVTAEVTLPKFRPA